MQKVIMIIMTLILSDISIMAQSMSDAWLAMPDTLMPYLNASSRKQLIAMKQQNDTVNAMVQNSFNTSTKLLHLSDSRLELYTEMPSGTPNSAKGSSIALTIAKLPYAEDSVFCIIKTLSSPEPISFVTIYNKVWQKIEDISFDNMELTQRPDTLSTSQYNELLKLIEPKMIKAELLPDERTLLLDLSMPLTTKEERERLSAILMQRKVKWNGKRFK